MYNYKTTHICGYTALLGKNCRAFTVTPLDKNTLTLLTYKDKQIYLVGTSHISSKSAEQVREIIQTVKPDTVLLDEDYDVLTFGLDANCKAYI